MRRPAAAAVAGTTGFAVMALELTAVRLMAPHFGDSAYVWTNVIGVILVALAFGAFLGGRMADRQLGRDRLFVLLLGAGILTCIVPVFASPLGGYLVPGDLPLDAAMGALVRGSLVATTLLFAPPVLLVGCVSPILVTILAAQDGRVGRASALVSWTATVGSLIGTFAATHLLIPHLGSRVTVWICAGCLIAAALMCKLRLAGAAGLILPLGLWFVVPARLKAPADGERLLAEVESNYQFLQVVEIESATGTQTVLRINEGLDSFHSVAYAGTPYTGGGYYDYHVVAPYLAGDGVVPKGLRVLSLGEAAGTFGRLFAHVYPGCVMDAVEIDPAVMRLGERFFPGTRPAGDRFALDARVFVERTSRRYDVVLVDTYKHQIYIPAHVASEQFFRAVHRVLRDGGIVSVNAGGVRFTDPVVHVLSGTMARVFGAAYAFQVPSSRNFVLMARRGRAMAPASLAAIATADAVLARIFTRTSRPEAWRVFQPGGKVLQDDRPFLDLLQEDVYSRHDADPVLLPMRGTRGVADVSREAKLQYQSEQIEDALTTLQTAQEPSALLRFLAGNCRWMLRDAAGAVLEYEEAKRLGSKQPSLDGNIEGARAEADGRTRAFSVASRNGWLACAGIVGVLLLTLAVACYPTPRPST